MAPRLTRRHALAGSATAILGGTAGCLRGEPPDGTVEYSVLDEIDWESAPPRKETTAGTPKPEFREYPAEGDPDVILILFHNATLDSRMLRPLSAAIADTGVAHVITPDIRGHGPEPIRRGDTDYVGQLTDDLVAIVNTANGLGRPKPLDEFGTVIVGGHGAGGGFATRIGADPLGDSLADAYLLLAPHLGRLLTPTSRRALGGWQELNAQSMLLAGGLNGLGVGLYNDTEVLRYAMPEAARYGGETRSYTFRLATELVPDDHTTITEIKGPTLTLVGSEDEAVQPSAYEPLLGDAENHQLSLLDGVSHLGLMDPSQTLEQTVAWIESLGG
ncbi:MAG: lysophospholipase [Halonotius sp. J07HN4]|nr:MAG: lysophospholipase [Halonotius sp. J07HN4]